MNIALGFKCAAAVAVTLVSQSAPPGAHAYGEKWALNGTFRAQSHGEWAQTNETYMDEQTVVSIWTISTACTGPTDCTGLVSSDRGWTAPIYQQSGLWNIKRSITGWERCPDGTAADGLQNYRFYPVNAVTGQQDFTQSNLFTGLDETKGISGACGTNKPLVITMPFQLERTT